MAATQWSVIVQLRPGSGWETMNCQDSDLNVISSGVLEITGSWSDDQPAVIGRRLTKRFSPNAWHSMTEIR